jgi:hypothetical protein
MIQKMKKLTFLVYHKEYEEFLEELQKLGVVHLQNADDQSAGDERNAALYSEVNKLEEELKHVAAIKKEMADLKGVDVAFLPVNQPYTMTVEQCVNAAKVIGPKALIPYHFSQTDLSGLPALLPGIDVRLRDMQ